MLDEERLRELSGEERAALLRALVAIDAPDPAVGEAGARRRVIGLAGIVICSMVLAAWIGVLAVTLPLHYSAHAWRTAWVGFDIGLLAAFLATGWAAWRRRQILILCLVVLATLLCCDAWFDVLLDVHTRGFWFSVGSAVLVELPLAALAISGAHRLLRTMLSVIWRYEGQPGAVPRLWKVPLLAGAPTRQLRDLFIERPVPPAAPH